MPDALVLHLRERLLRNLMDNIVALGPQKALTGPAARGDFAAIARQAAVVADWDPQAAAAYRALSDLALRMASLAAESSPVTVGSTPSPSVKNLLTSESFLRCIFELPS